MRQRVHYSHSLDLQVRFALKVKPWFWKSADPNLKIASRIDRSAVEILYSLDAVRPQHVSRPRRIARDVMIMMTVAVK